MFEFHHDTEKYFQINIANTRRYIIPFIEQYKTVRKGMRILEIGCGEGGVLKTFLDLGCIGVGVELDESRLIDAQKILANEIANQQLKLVSKNIYDADVEQDLGGKFDIILLKDVIEHIPNQEKLLEYLQGFLKPDGVIFFGFPPWQMPFGGHQQLLRNKLLSKLPYYHLLPMPVYKKIMQKANENVQEMTDIKETGISIDRFEKISKETGYTIAAKQHFLVNPIYEYKFGWKPRTQFSLISAVPVLRNFLTTCAYYLLTPKNKNL